MSNKENIASNKYRKCAKCGATSSVIFHRFPKPGKTNLLKARAWAKYCWPEQEWISVPALTKLYTSNKVLCEKHFADYFFTDSSKKRLSKFCVPGDTAHVANLMNTLRSEMHLMKHEMAPQVLEPLPSTSGNREAQVLEPLPSTSGNREAQILSNPCLFDSNQLLTTKNQQAQIPKPLIKRKLKHLTLKSLGVDKLRKLSLKEKLLYNVCQNQVRKISRLKQEVNKFKKKGNLIKNLVKTEYVTDLLDLNMSNEFVSLLQSQLQNCPKKKKGRRYDIEQKIIALTWYKKSPAMYRLLRRMVALPCQRTLNNLLNRIPLTPGINSQVFAGLKSMAENQRLEDNICILSFDEMAIRKHIQYNRRMDYLEGFQDHGNHGRSSEIACNALVFMLAGLRKKWKQPIAFYFSGKCVTSDRVAVIIKEVIRECFKTGLIVVATVCDMSRVNIKALDILGSTNNKPYFNLGDKEIITIFDPPHLLKCFRNLFLKYNVECVMDTQLSDNVLKGIAKWSDIQDFYNMDKTNPNFVFVPTLTEQHLNPNAQQKMRVKLAAQIFSHSVAAGMLAKISANHLPAEATATATLLDKIDKLFDALNADSADLRRGKKFSTNMTRHSPHLGLFKEMKQFITNMRFIGCTTKPPSQMGWIRTMNAVEKLWFNLSKYHVQCLATRRINQDVLENCFGCIRYNCGSNVNPTVEQFVAGIKTAIISNLRHGSHKTNCEKDSASIANNLKPFLLQNEKEMFVDATDESVELDPLMIAISDAAEAIHQASPEAQACAYVCGFIVKRQNNVCQTCQALFVSNECNEPLHIFTNIREYNTLNNSLKYVNKSMVQCVETCASLIHMHLKDNDWKNGLKKRIESILDCVDFEFLKDCGTHYEENKKFIIVSCFFICLKRYAILKNRQLKEDEHKKSLERKMKILGVKV